MVGVVPGYGNEFELCEDGVAASRAFVIGKTLEGIPDGAVIDSVVKVRGLSKLLASELSADELVNVILVGAELAHFVAARGRNCSHPCQSRWSNDASRRSSLAGAKPARAEILVRSGFGYSVQWSEVIERPERRGGGDLYVTVSAVAQRGEPGRIQ